MIEPNLIFDVGFHKCEDTCFYLSKGYKVIAIDADVSNIAFAESKCEKEILSGQLITELCAVTDKEYDEITFNKSKCLPKL